MIIKNNMYKFSKNKNSGQAMVLMVMILGSIMLGVTTVAGYITIQKIRTVSDIVNSMKAIYAADYGIEKCFNAKFSSGGSASSTCDFSKEILENSGASVEVKESGGIVKSVGNSGRSWRAFGIFLNEFNN